MSTYAIRGGEAGARRLDLLAQVMAPTTDALLSDAGVREGMTCLDVGCGAGHVSRCLATRVGSGGTVIGLDFDLIKLATARKDLTLSTLVNIADAAVAEGLGTPEELQRAIAELEAFTEEEDSIIGCPRIFQVWGRTRAQCGHLNTREGPP